MSSSSGGGGVEAVEVTEHQVACTSNIKGNSLGDKT
jgi:hypothetical protein